MNKKILNIIRKKRELSQLPEKDIEIAYSRFEKNDLLEEEKIEKTKEILRKNFIAFVSKKLFSLKNKDVEWILRKHISTKERLPFYQEIYKRIFKKLKKLTLIDLDSGINGFSYSFFPKNVEINYLGIESVGQLVDLTNFYFKKNKISGKVIHMSLFEKEELKKIIKKQKKPRVIFLFKVIDSLEIFKKNYSKELILELIELVDFMVLSFATKTLRNKKPFFAKRDWIINFIKENFKVLDDFEFGGERYFIFCKDKLKKDL